MGQPAILTHARGSYRKPPEGEGVHPSQNVTLKDILEDVPEDDRSTENQSRFRDKIRAYFHYIEEGLHSHKFGIKHFRVLTVATTDERAKNLASMTRELLPERGRKYFLFVS